MNFPELSSTQTSVQTPMQISLYIPAFNAAAYLGECLQGIFEQTRKPDEIIVIDDGSKDATAKIARTFSGVKLISHQQNLGLAAARNSAVRAAQFAYVASIDADCVPHADWLAALATAMMNSPHAGVGGMLIERYQSTIADRWRATHLRQNRGEIALVNPPFLFGHSTIFRKNLIIEAGLYHEKLKTNAEDVELSERLLRLGQSLYYEPKAVVEHLKRDSLISVAKTNWRYYFFGYFYDITLRNYVINFRRNGVKRFAEILALDLQKNLSLFPLSLGIILYCLIKDALYILQNYGQKRLYD